MPDKVFRLIIDVDSRKAKRGADQAEKSMKKLSGSMALVTKAAVGMGAVFGTLALAQAFRRGLDSAIEFERSMTRINTLVGVSTEVVAEWGDELGRIAKTSAIGANQLADALFAVTSAGARGAEAMDILEKSAQAATVGLGDVTSIARTVGAAMQAYKESGLTAAAATDILVATVREGNLEAASLANSLGPILGIAAEMGVEFSDLGAAIAIYTRLGVTAEQATTGLRATLASLLTPTTDQLKAFSEMGLSVDALRKQIQDEGLAAALLSISDAAQGNSQAIARAIPEQRALAAVLGLTGGQADQLVESQEALRNATGDLGKAFGGTQESAAFKVDQFKVSVSELTRTFSQELLPALEPVVQALTALTAAFSKLGDVIDVLRGGPIADLAGKLIGPSEEEINKLKEGFDGLLGTLEDIPGTAERALVGLSRVGVGAGSSLSDMAKGAQEFVASLSDLDDLKGLEKQIARLERLEAITADLEKHRKTVENLAQEYEDWLRSAEFFREGLDLIDDGLANLASSIDSLNLGDLEGIDALVDSFTSGIIDSGNLEAAIDEVTAGIIASFDPSAGFLETFAEGFSDRMGQALANAFASGDVQDATDGLINALSAAAADAANTAVQAALPGAGQILGPIAGGIAGGLAQQLLGGLFGDDEEAKRQAQEMEAAFTDLHDAIRSSMPGIRQEVIETFEAILDILRLMGEAGQATGEEMAAIGRELQNTVDSITGISTGDFADRISAAQEFNQTLLTMPENIQAAFDQIDLSALAESIAAEFMGITSHLDLSAAQRDAQHLREAISGLGLESGKTADLLRQVTQAERLRIAEIRAGALAQLADLMERAGIRSAEAAQLRAKYEQIQFQVALKRLEVELQLLNLWTKATQQIIGELTEFAGNLGNFVGGITGGLSAPLEVPRVGGRRGGGGRRQKRRDLLDELERLMNTGGGNTFADRLRDLNKQFAELRKRARKLKVPLEKVNAAYEAQLKALRDQALGGLRDFRDNLLTGPLSPLSMQQRFFAARTRFNDLARRAAGGDLDATAQLGAASQEYLDLARQMFGTTQQFDRIFDEVLGLVNGVLGIGGLKDEEATRHDQVLSQLQNTDELQLEMHGSANDWREKNWKKNRDNGRVLEEIRDVLGRLENVA